MASYLGLDIGTNSVGSAWVDTKTGEISLGVTIFSAGIDEKTKTSRGQERREHRSARRTTRRRAQRKEQLKRILIEHNLLPPDSTEWEAVYKLNPWYLRRDGLSRELTPHEFGRVLVHLTQRRGALGVNADEEESGQGEVKEAINKLTAELNGRTIGQFMADQYDLLAVNVKNKKTQFRKAIRNLRDSFQWHAHRELLHDEFQKLWEKQVSFEGELSRLLTDDLKLLLDNPEENTTWRHQGAIFGQRRTYWDTGTLGRCDLEPSDRCCPLADMYAQEYRVIESVNNIRFREREGEWRSLTLDERNSVLNVLRKQKTASPKTIRKALGIDKAALKKKGIPADHYRLNIENDSERDINTDWFYREFVHGVFGEDRWNSFSIREQESVNKAILKFDPENEKHRQKLLAGAQSWWGLPAEEAELFIEAWSQRPRLEKRLNLSCKAIKNVLCYMEEFDVKKNRWPTQIEARKRFATDLTNGATAVQRTRYGDGILSPEERSELGDNLAPGNSLLTKADRHFQRKHPNTLPPAPMISNPVVRKAIHEVRRHVNAHIRNHDGQKPDRIVIEFIRGVTQTAKVKSEIKAKNDKRAKERKAIEAELKSMGIPESNWRRAALRVKLCREQKGVCPFSLSGSNENQTITEEMAAWGTDLEIEHIIPQSRTGRTMAFNNIVLCFTEANRDKGDRTPLDWLGSEKLEQVLQRLGKSDVKKNQPKWRNLQAKTPDDNEESRNSQLTDTAYAATQVAAYLDSALYHDKTEGERKIFSSNGSLTGRMRRDWGLQESEIDKDNNLEPPIDEAELAKDPRLAQARRKSRKEPKKERVDHRHHALDAIVIALTNPKLLEETNRLHSDALKHKEETGSWPKRVPLSPPKPWKSLEDFRQTALHELNNLVISHRPQRRKIVGGFHDANPCGKATKYPGLYTIRKDVSGLKVKELVRPAKDKKTGLWKIPGAGQGKAVYDDRIRDEIISCLKRNGIDPGKFNENDIKRLTTRPDWKMCMKSGVPIYAVTMLTAMSDPIEIIGKDGVARYYKGGNNHHIEILEDEKSGKWSGYCWDMFKVARRVRPPKNFPNLPMVIGSQLDQLRESGDLEAGLNALYNDPDLLEWYQGKRFVMSLSIGETVCMRHPKEKDVIGYFTVYKLDKTKKKIFLTHHWDARPSEKKEETPPRESVECSVLQLKDLQPEEGVPPYKVSVSPIGKISRLND